MDKDKVKIMMWGVIIFLIGYIIIDFVDDSQKENKMIQEAIELTEQAQATQSPGVPQAIKGTNIGEVAYDFELKDMNGDTVRLSDLRGQKVFLNFWSSWCPPCRLEAPHLQLVHENNDDIVILGVNVTESESNIDNVQGFIDEFDLTYPNLYETNDISLLYNAMSLPTSYFIDSNGVIQDIAIGAITEDIIEERFSIMD